MYKSLPQINITSFNLFSSPPCADYVTIQDGNSTAPLLSKLCSGNGTIATIETSDNIAFIRFKSDASGVASGFALTYSAGEDSCGGSFNIDSGVITSPNYPRPYTHRRRCLWYITVPEGRRITLTFTDFQLENPSRWNYCYDSVQAFDGLNTDHHISLRICGNNIPDVIQSSMNKMTLEFRTDGDTAHTGFR